MLTFEKGYYYRFGVCPPQCDAIITIPVIKLSVEKRTNIGINM